MLDWPLSPLVAASVNDSAVRVLPGAQTTLQLTSCEGTDSWVSVIRVFDADLALEVIIPTVSVARKDTFDVCNLKLTNSLSCGKLT